MVAVTKSCLTLMPSGTGEKTRGRKNPFSIIYCHWSYWPYILFERLPMRQISLWLMPLILLTFYFLNVYPWGKYPWYTVVDATDPIDLNYTPWMSTYGSCRYEPTTIKVLITASQKNFSLVGHSYINGIVERCAWHFFSIAFWHLEQKLDFANAKWHLK